MVSYCDDQPDGMHTVHDAWLIKEKGIIKTPMTAPNL
jgi:hypothetical protein